MAPPVDGQSEDDDEDWDDRQNLTDPMSDMS